MKLLQKTTRTYMVFATLLLLVAGALLYFLLANIFEEEWTEKLLVNKDRIVQQLKAGQPVHSIPPIMEIESLTVYQPDTFFVNDVLLFDPIEEEVEPFRELRAIENRNGHTFQITLRQVILEPHDFLNSISLALAFVLVLLLVGLYFLNRGIFQKIWQPFYANLSALHNFSLEKNEPMQLVDSNITEFKEMKTAIEKLTQKAGNDYTALKEFTENASHEMQTPLAIILANIEEALQAPTLSADQAGHLNTAAGAVHRLTHLNRSLLLLAKIENRQFLANEPISIFDKINDQLAHYKGFIKQKEINVTFDNPSRLMVNANPNLMDILLGNLLGNAIRHNIIKGQINILLDENSLVISNTGKPFLGDPMSLFGRFKKGDTDAPSQGLGLSIVKKICENHGWEIGYGQEGEWHRLRLYFFHSAQ